MVACSRIRIFAFCALSLIASAGLAAESKPAQAEAPIPYSFESGPGRVPISEGTPGEFSGPVHITYGGIKLASDHLIYQTFRPSQSTSQVVEWLHLEAGPTGPEPTRIHLDSRESTLPSVGFRGLLTPESFAAKYDAAGSSGNQRRYVISLASLGYFFGDLKTEKGWSPYGGRADHAELIVLFDVDGDQMSKFRFESIHLFGREAEGETSKETAFLATSPRKINDKEAVKLLGSSKLASRVDSMTLTIEFDDQGQVLRYRTGTDFTMTGSGVPLPMMKQSRAKLENGPKSDK